MDLVAGPALRGLLVFLLEERVGVNAHLILGEGVEARPGTTDELRLSVTGVAELGDIEGREFPLKPRLGGFRLLPPAFRGVSPVAVGAADAKSGVDAREVLAGGPVPSVAVQAGIEAAGPWGRWGGLLP